MDIRITPAPLSGEIRAISSKSHAHRLLIAAFLAGADHRQVVINDMSADIEATGDCLAALNAEQPALQCGESGSTLRFLLPVAAALGREAVFSGQGRLPQRPLSPLKEELAAHGCSVMKSANQSLEICRIQGKLRGGTFSLPGDISSQYITGLLFALPLLDEDSEIILTTPLESKSYVDLTLSVLAEFGIEILAEPDLYRIKGRQKYEMPADAIAEGDWSNSAFWLAAGALPGSRGISCSGIDRDSSQGDKAITKLLERFGAEVRQSKTSVSVSPAELKTIRIDAADIPDLVPVLAVIASVAEGTTIIENAGRLRIKESDRLSAVSRNLRVLGAQIEELPEGLIIKGVPFLTGGEVDGCNDHRIVMSAAIAASMCRSPVIISGCRAVDKSYPNFFEDYKKLGGIIDVI